MPLVRRRDLARPAIRTTIVTAPEGGRAGRDGGRPRLRARRRRRGRRWPTGLHLAGRLAAVLCVGALGLAADPHAPGAGAAPRHVAGGPVTYAPPVDAPVIDPFRPPATPYGPGNRGLDYATPPGTPVLASADGTVVFAGPVGGTLHVTILHADGIRTSYSFLAAIAVVTGQRVRRGDSVGTSADVLHFGARSGGAYLDPALLFAGARVEVELLPLPARSAAAPATRAGEARALAGLLADIGGRAAWTAPRPAPRSPGCGPGPPRGPPTTAQVPPLARGLDIADDLAARLVVPGPCSADPPPVRPVAGQRRVAVTVAGLGSSSTSGSVDELRAGDLGYDRDRVVRFSYAGGRTPGTGTGIAGIGEIPATDYLSADTQGDIVGAARRLADLLAQVLAIEPDVTIDVFAHSLGGLVARLALDDLVARGVDVGRLGLVAILGSPVRGADLASAVVAAGQDPAGGILLDAAESVLDTGLDPGAPVVRQLAEPSALVARIDAAVPPPGVDLVSIAARGDLVAAAPATELAGAAQRDRARVRALGTQRPRRLRRRHRRAGPGAGRDPAGLRGMGRRGRRRPDRSRHRRRRGLARGGGLRRRPVSAHDRLARRSEPRPRTPTARHIAAGPTHGRPHGRRAGHANRWEGSPRGRRHHEAAPRGGCPFRAPDPALEPEDEAVHLRRAQRHLHHRSAADPRPDRDRLHLRPRRHVQGRLGALHRHQEAGPGPDRAVRRQVRHALHQRALAGWHADQLPDDEQAGRQDARARAPARLRRVRGHAQEGSPAQDPRARQARALPRWDPIDGPPAPGRVRARHQEGAHRGHRGQQAGHPGRRRGRHQLRPRRHRLRDPRQRRRHPRGHPAVPGDRRRRDRGQAHGLPPRAGRHPLGRRGAAGRRPAGRGPPHGTPRRPAARGPGRRRPSARGRRRTGAGGRERDRAGRRGLCRRRSGRGRSERARGRRRRA